MSRKDFLDGFIEVAREFKNHLWEQHQERDMPPTIGLITRDGDLMQVPNPLIAKLSRDVDNVTDLLDWILRGISEGKAPIALENIQQIILLADGYSVISDDPNVLDNFGQRGGMPASFADDPESPVSECVTVYCGERNSVGDCDLNFARLNYALGDGGKLTWDDETFYVLADDENSPWDFMDAPVYKVFRKYLRTEGLA